MFLSIFNASCICRKIRCDRKVFGFCCKLNKAWLVLQKERRSLTWGSQGPSAAKEKHTPSITGTLSCVLSNPALDGAAVVAALVEVPVPDHHAAVVGRRLRHGEHRPPQRPRLREPTPSRLRRRRQADVELGERVRRRPLAPLHGAEPGGAVRIVVEPDMDALKDARVERLLDAGVREPAARRRREVQQLAVAGADVVLGELQRQRAVVLGGGGVVQEHVDAVQPRVAERPAAGVVVKAAAEVGVPEVVEERQRRRVGGQGVGAAEAADGDGDGDAQELAPLDGRAHAGGRVAG